MVKDPQTGTSVKSNGWTYRVRMGHQYSNFSGIVVYSGWYMGFGQLLMIDHGQGYRIYAHLSKLNVQKGDRVQQGDLVGRLGDTVARGPKLYLNSARTGRQKSCSLAYPKTLNETFESPRSLTIALPGWHIENPSMKGMEKSHGWHD